MTSGAPAAPSTSTGVYALARLPAVGSVAVPIVPGNIQVSVPGYYDSDTCFLCRPIPPFASPVRSVRDLTEVAMLRYFGGNTIVIDGSIAAIARPARPDERFCQVTALRYRNGNALIVHRPIPTDAFPTVAGVIQVAIGWDCNSRAAFLDPSISVTALPPGSERIIRLKGIRRDSDNRAHPLLLSIALVTVPSASVSLGGGIRGNLRRDALGESDSTQWRNDRRKSQDESKTTAELSDANDGSLAVWSAARRCRLQCVGTGQFTLFSWAGLANMRHICARGIGSIGRRAHKS